MTERKLDRLHKIIAATGILSRRAAETAILQGRVHVDGKLVNQLGTVHDPMIASITVDGKPLPKEKRADSARVVILLNKPREVMTTKYDPEGRRTVMDLIPNQFQHVNPVGRLDYLSEGLLVLTNDGELTHQYTHPSFNVKKVYETKVAGNPLPQMTLNQLLKSVTLEDGPGRFEKIERLTLHPWAPIGLIHAPSTIYKVSISEGRNRFIRRMFEAVDRNVLRLKRIQMGKYVLGDLRPGEMTIID